MNTPELLAISVFRTIFAMCFNFLEKQKSCIIFAPVEGRFQSAGFASAPPPHRFRAHSAKVLLFILLFIF